MEKEYEYSKVNRLKKPHTYMYTNYLGKDFLKLFFDSRKECIKFLEQDLIEEDLIGEINKELKRKNGVYKEEYIKKDLNRIYIEKKIVTKDILEKMAFFFLNYNKKENIVTYEILNDFCKKYETTKKVFSQYERKNNILKPTVEEYQIIYNYSLLSFCLLSYFRHGKNLKFLNCTLKINDALCSVIKQIEKQDKLTKLFTLESLYMEKKTMCDLINKKGIFL